MRHPLASLALLAGAALSPAIAQKPESVATPGLAWARDLADAHASSAKDGKPVVAYFTFET